MPPGTDLEWMEAHGRVLFTRDARGDLLRVNESGGGPAPRVWMGLTAEGTLRAFRSDVPEETRRRIAAVPDGETAAIREALERDAPIVREWRGPAFRFPAGIAADDPGDLRRMGPEDAGMLRRWFAGLEAEIDVRQPCLAVIVEDVAVSVAHAARCDVGFVEAGVETAGGHRGRGHATRVVAAWARAVREEGREPLYSTSRDNAASLALARRLGLVRFGEDVHFT